MGDHHDDSAPGNLFTDHRDEPRDGSGVEARRRLIEEDESRRVNEGARKGNALALAARVRSHRAVGECAEIEAVHGA
jgi:hypothetical protein